MTLKTCAIAAVLLAVASACDPDPAPVSGERTLIPLRMEAPDATRELVYDESGRLSGLTMITRFPNGVEMKSLQSFRYNETGLLVESSTDTGWRIEYVWDGGHLLEAHEYVEGNWTQVHRFTYNDENQLTYSRTFQDIPEEGGLIPVASSKFMYDVDGNLIEHRMFYFTSFGAEEKLLTVLAFDDYDDRRNSEELFSFSPFNPVTRYSKNNPGVMTVTNGNGVVSSVNRYSYTYNEDDYAISKTATVTIAGQPDQQFQTTYTFGD